MLPVPRNSEHNNVARGDRISTGTNTHVALHLFNLLNQRLFVGITNAKANFVSLSGPFLSLACRLYYQHRLHLFSYQRSFLNADTHLVFRGYRITTTTK